MSISRGYFDGPHAIVVFLSLVVPVVTYTVFNLVALLRKEETKQAWPRLKRLQLVGTVIVLSISVAHCAILAKPLQVSGTPDPTLVYALYQVLLWITLLLGLCGEDHDAGPAHVWAWSSFAVFEAVALIVVAIQRVRTADVSAAVDVALLASRVVIAIGLGASTALVQTILSPMRDAKSADEVQPLLPSSNTTDPETQATGKANDNFHDSSDDDDGDGDDGDDKPSDDDDDDDDANDQDKADIEALKKRPFREYVASFGIFIPLLKPRNVQQWFFIAVVAACTAVERGMNVAIPLALGSLINHLTGATTVPWKQVITFLTLSVLDSAGIISTVKQLANVRFSSSIKWSFNEHCYSHVMNLSAEFHDGKSSQRIGRIIDNGDRIVYFVEELLFDLGPRVADLLISLGVISWLFGAYLCFVVATTIVLFAWTNLRFVKQKTTYRRKNIDAWIDLWQHMWETHHAWTTVSHFNRVEHEKSQFQTKATKMLDTEIASEVFEAGAQLARQITVASGFVAAMVLVVNQITFGDLGVGDFVMLTTYWTQVMAPVTGLIRLVNRASEKLVDAEKLMLILERKPAIKDATDAKDLDFQGGAVDFEDVSFSYDGERAVSEDISFHIKAGQTVAIVGETGGGKSTLLKLLFRFYDPTKGRILVDGQDIRTLRLDSFREIFGFVPQDPALFHRSIFNNTRYSDLSATHADVEEACQGAVLHDKIMTFPKKYKQKVGERGARLSGGEGQRLAIARVILKKPKMLLLDEATSSVDSVTEAKIHEALQKLCHGKTTFIIAHRLSTILHADQILVIKNGKLMEAGPHRELMQRDGPYRELWTAQLKLQAADPDADQNPNPDRDQDEKDGTTAAEKEDNPGSDEIPAPSMIDEHDNQLKRDSTAAYPSLEENERSSQAFTVARSDVETRDHGHDQN